MDPVLDLIVSANCGEELVVFRMQSRTLFYGIRNQLRSIVKAFPPPYKMQEPRKAKDD